MARGNQREKAREKSQKEAAQVVCVPIPEAYPGEAPWFSFYLAAV
jgi:hypothetical protein